LQAGPAIPLDVQRRQLAAISMGRSPLRIDAKITPRARES